MAEYTKNYKLEKQQGNDYISIDGINENFDIIDAEIKKLNDNKVDIEEGKGLSSNDYTTVEKNKLASIADNANNYTHPTTHPPNIIAQNANNRFVTDSEKATWNGKANAVSPIISGHAIFQKGDGSNLYYSGQIELQGLNNTPPLIGFHRPGVTAVALYEHGKRLYTTTSDDTTPHKVMQDNDFIFQTTIPTTLADGVICFVYE